MRTHQFLLTFVLFLSIYTIDADGQIPVIKLPQPGTVSPGIVIGSPSNAQDPTPKIPAFPGINSGQQPQNTYEQDRLEVERRNAAVQQSIYEEAAAFGNSFFTFIISYTL